MNINPTKMSDCEIALALEKQLKPIGTIAKEFGLKPDEYTTYGDFVAKVDCVKLFGRLGKDRKQRAKYIDVTSINPTPFGEGKTTTTVGLVQGLGKLGKKVSGAIRQPSSGPTFNLKGSAAGGGLSQCLPLGPFSVGLTGDIDAVTNANNLAMVALTARMQHEKNYDDDKLVEKSGMWRLDIDPDRVQMKWAMDFCAQALRNIVIGKGGKMDGFEMKSSFYISVASEVMAILAVAKDLSDLRDRIANIIVAYDKRGNPVTTNQLNVDGAMTAWLVKALQPNLMQTGEGQPMLVHAGPFANIAVGQSSIIADLVGCALSDYHVTESGFGSDIGFEKFWNIKCKSSGLKPDAVVLTVTIRALKAHGGAPVAKPGAKLDDVYTTENIQLVRRGYANLQAHIDIIKQSGVDPIVCLNRFPTDTDAEIFALKALVNTIGEVKFVVTDNWRYGGKGAIELAKAVVEACDKSDPENFKFLVDDSMTMDQKIETIAKNVYGANGVEYTEQAQKDLKQLMDNPATAKLDVCMAKTQYSLSHDPSRLGRPVNWKLPIKRIVPYTGAGWVVPFAGEIKDMPGTTSSPGFRNIDVDVMTGDIVGLF